MFILEEQIHPRCTAYMKKELQPITLKRNRRKIFDAFVKACENEACAIGALTWGKAPKVVIGGSASANNKCGSNPVAFFNQNNSVVTISHQRVRPLEFCTSVDIVDNQRRFESTLLHELVHFARMKCKLTDLNWDFPDSEEPGEQFEFWAYGGLQCTREEVNAG